MFWTKTFFTKISISEFSEFVKLKEDLRTAYLNVNKF